MILFLAAGNPMRMVLRSLLIFEVIAFGLSIPVMIQVSGVSGLWAGVLGGMAMLLCLVAAGLLKSRVGFLVGWLAQLVGVLLGLLTPGMYVIGGMFLALWILTIVLGHRIESGRREMAVDPGR
ncbi:MAG: DUF4233 domain-containing protein [Propionibacteriaceae bacterium]